MEHTQQIVNGYLNKLASISLAFFLGENKKNATRLSSSALDATKLLLLLHCTQAERKTRNL